MNRNNTTILAKRQKQKARKFKRNTPSDIIMEVSQPGMWGKQIFREPEQSEGQNHFGGKAFLFSVAQVKKIAFFIHIKLVK
jgi:hypothetical protein